METTMEWCVYWKFRGEPQGGDHWRLDSMHETEQQATDRRNEMLNDPDDGWKICAAVERRN